MTSRMTSAQCRNYRSSRSSAAFAVIDLIAEYSATICSKLLRVGADGEAGVRRRSRITIEVTERRRWRNDVPAHKYTFGVVKAAEARGDFEVFAERGRRLLRG